MIYFYWFVLFGDKTAMPCQRSPPQNQLGVRAHFHSGSVWDSGGSATSLRCASNKGQIYYAGLCVGSKSGKFASRCREMNPIRSIISIVFGEKWEWSANWDSSRWFVHRRCRSPRPGGAGVRGRPPAVTEAGRRWWLRPGGRGDWGRVAVEAAALAAAAAAAGSGRGFLSLSLCLFSLGIIV